LVKRARFRILGNRREFNGLEGRSAVLRSGLRSLARAVRLEMLASLRRQNSVSQAYGCFRSEGSATRQLAFRYRDFGKRRWSWPLCSISLNRSLEAERGSLVEPGHRQIHRRRRSPPSAPCIPASDICDSVHHRLVDTIAAPTSSHYCRSPRFR
jgi:hypothetical protein